MVICIDFDGTCVTHKYPAIGDDVGAIPVLNALVDAGHQLILYTMRSDDKLAAAVDWFVKNDIPLYGINQNPTQHTWTKSPKVYAPLYIDDAALGAPLIYPDDGRPFIDWERVSDILINDGII